MILRTPIIIIWMKITVLSLIIKNNSNANANYIYTNKTNNHEINTYLISYINNNIHNTNNSNNNSNISTNNNDENKINSNQINTDLILNHNKNMYNFNYNNISK